MTTSKEDDTKNLHMLNGRLQQYFLRVQQITEARDTAEHELALVRERLEKDLSSTRLKLNNELEKTRQELEAEIDQRSRLQVLEQEQHQELQVLRNEVKDLKDAHERAERLRLDLDKERTNAHALKQKLDHSNTELTGWKRKINSMERESRKEMAKSKDMQAEIDRLREENQEFLSGRDTQVETLRKEFTEKMRKDTASWKEKMEVRIAQATKESKEVFTASMEAKKVEIEGLKKELGMVKKDKEHANQELELALNARGELSARVSDLERQYAEERRRWKQDNDGLQETIASLREDAAEREQEYNALLDSKLTVDAEIETYRMILDQEESRVGGLSTPKPKRRVSTGQRSARSSNKKAKKFSGPVRIATLDLENDFIVIENVGLEPVNLTGWKIMGQANQKSFTYPKFELDRNQKCMVKCNKKGKAKNGEVSADGMASFVTRKFLWEAAGDAATLCDPQGNVVHRMAKGLPEPEKESEDGKMMAEDDEDYHSDEMEPLPNVSENQCCIM